MARTLALLLVLGLAGCASTEVARDGPEPSDDLPLPMESDQRGGPGGTASRPPARPPTSAPPTEPPAPVAEILGRPIQASWDDVLSIAVPLDVVLLGFAPGAAEHLAAAMSQPYGPDQFTLHAGEYVDPEPVSVGEGYSITPLPMRQTVAVRVLRAPDADVAAYVGAVSGPTSWDGNAALAWAHARLAGWGATGTLPALVLVHAGTTGHAYNVAYDNGAWQSARVMGGDGRALLMDLSADVDPWTGDNEDYARPVGPEDGAALVSAVHDAVRFRLLQGALYPVPHAPCHAVTLLYAVHVASELGLVSDLRADDAVDVARLEEAFEELTLEEVHVDLVRLDLPHEDPALWALVRGAAPGIWVNPVGNPLWTTSGHVQTLVRAWVEANWETYHVEHAGCEEYLSVLVYGDAADLGWMYGFASYDAGDSHRYSFSIVPEMYRAMYEPGPAGIVTLCCKPGEVESFDVVNMLFAHETGHLFGQSHPHNTMDREDPQVSWAFSTTRTVMSYLVDELDVSFGTLDQWNWQRNRLAFVGAALDEAGLRQAAINAGFLQMVRDGDLAGAAAIGQALLAS